MIKFNELAKAEVKRLADVNKKEIEEKIKSSNGNGKQYLANFEEIAKQIEGNKRKYSFVVLQLPENKEVYKQETKMTSNIEEIKVKAKEYIKSYYGSSQVLFNF